MRYFIEPSDDDPNPRYPCGKCERNVSARMKAIKCDSCGYWNHIRCDGITPYDYDKMLKLPISVREKITHFCQLCKEECFPFHKISDEEFITSIVKNVAYNEDLNLRICPSEGIKRLFTDFSNHNEDEAVTINCDYYDATTPIPNTNRPNCSMFHLNIASLAAHKDELIAAISLTNVEFDIIAISETRIIKGQDPTYDITLPGYKEYSTPTESTKGGVIIYMKEAINVKRRTDLESKLYEPGMLESVFLETMNDKKKNEIFGCIYRHPTMDIKTFNDKYFNEIMTKITDEKKTCYLAGDFNIDLLKSEMTDTKDYFDILTTNLFVPHITLPTRVTNRSQTLIDNIFSNNPEFENCTSGNFTFSISDHLAQFLIIPSSVNRPPKIHNMKVRDMRNYSHEELVADIININWTEVLEADRADPDHSFQRFNDKINEILDKHMPWRKLNKKEIRLQTKPWITNGILNSIKRRDKLLRKYIEAKDPTRKEELRTEYKTLRNRITYIICNSKKNHFQQYFAENCDNIRKTWTGIKNIINIRTITKNQPSSMLIDKNLKTNPADIAEGFNAYFSSIAEKLLPKQTPGTKHVSEFLILIDP